MFKKLESKRKIKVQNLNNFREFYKKMNCIKNTRTLWIRNNRINWKRKTIRAMGVYELANVGLRIEEWEK